MELLSFLHLLTSPPMCDATFNGNIVEKKVNLGNLQDPLANWSFPKEYNALNHSFLVRC